MTIRPAILPKPATQATASDAGAPLPMEEALLSVAEAPGAARAGEAAQVSPPPRGGELAARVLQQLGEAMPPPGGQMTEIALDPEELGRVRLGIVTGEDGVIVHVHAERPETLDLLRRHLDGLAEELRRLGYAAVAFDLSGGGADTRDPRGKAAQAEAPDIAPPDGPQPSVRERIRTAGGLDLRL